MPLPERTPASSRVKNANRKPIPPSELVRIAVEPGEVDPRLFRHEEIRGARAASGEGLGKHGSLNSLEGLTPSGIKRIAKLLAEGRRLQTGLSGDDIEEFLLRMMNNQ